MMSPFSKPHISFSTKVLIPVVGTMIGLVVLAVLLIGVQVSSQVRSTAYQALFASRMTFEHLNEMRTQELLMRSSIIPNDNRFKTAAQHGDTIALREVLRDFVEESDVDAILSLDAAGNIATGAGSDLGIDPFSIEIPPALARRAREGVTGAAKVVAGGRLYDLIVVPVDISNSATSALVVAAEISNQTTRDMYQLVGCDIAFVQDGLVLASTVYGPGHAPIIAKLANGGEPNEADEIRTVRLGNEYFLPTTGSVESLEGQPPIQYVLLSDYGPQLRTLRSAQNRFALFGLLGCLVSSIIAWLVIHSLTRPLHELRTRVEAVGRGEFDQHIPATSHDEFGDLARAFNEMTGSLNVSREELEHTVSTLGDTRAKLLQSEKLSAIGEFIAGVAHELNNPLTIMVGYAQLLEESDLDDERKQEIRSITEASERCHKIVQNLLSFARQRPPEWSRIGINELLQSTIQFLRYELRTSNIDTEEDYDPELPLVMADPHQLQQVLLNIINNARQAMEEHQIKGEIRVRTASDGETVQLWIEDTGPGIPEHHLERIFDPFFTTKKQGKGTGLGLSVSYGIIKEHQGDIQVESRSGEGTTFTISLPVAAAEEGASAAESNKDSATRLSAKKGQRVLVVDDEEDILRLTRKMLTSAGFEVDTANSGNSALSKLRQNRYDLILSDWKMPGITGQELYQRLRELDPGLTSRFIFMTGDVLNDRMQRFVEDSGATCLSKPFSLDEFRASLQVVMNQA